MGAGTSFSPSSCLIFISIVRAMAVTGVSLGRLRKRIRNGKRFFQ